MIRLDGVAKTYSRGNDTIHAIRDISLEVAAGEFCAITGPSGSGKTTLMNLLGLLDKPSRGQIFIDGSRVSFGSDDGLANIRNRKIGFVFQTFHLLPRLSAAENVALPLLYRGIGARQARARAAEELARVGLGARAAHRPDELSGGQRQRVAIARALVGDPSIILADEPTGALDDVTAKEVIDIFRDLRAERQVCVVIVTHDARIAERCDRRLTIDRGSIVEASPLMAACGI